MIDTKQHPADREPHKGEAYTLEEGGPWIKGPPKPGAAFHSVVFADGWVFDTYLCRKGINRGARRVHAMPVFVDGVSQSIVMDVSQFGEAKSTDEQLGQVKRRLTAVEQRLSNLLDRPGAQQNQSLFGSIFGP